MAHLVGIERSVAATTAHGRLPFNSPFYSRAYGGYTADQQRFYLKHVGRIEGKLVLDPMAGQGFLLADLAYQGGNVWLGDINPALCLLASLRAPEMIRSRKSLALWIDRHLDKVRFTSERKAYLEYVDEWVPKNIQLQLREYREFFGLDSSPFKSSRAFWRLSARKRFAAALPVLAARDLACFRSSDNHTWIKPGGLQRENQIVDPIKRTLAAWLQFAERHANGPIASDNWGELFAQKMDATTGHFGSAPRVDAIITSPPYANRLDYTRMWGPEFQIAAAIWSESTHEVKLNQIGSNVIRGTAVDDNILECLPRAILNALKAIKNDDDYASESYYFPFFRNYAASLMRAIRQISPRLKSDGLMVVFVRDTVRKDIMFPTGLLVEKVMHEAGYRTVGKERQIVKQHVGLRRKGAGSGLYGVGQLEWWLAFRR